MEQLSRTLETMGLNKLSAKERNALLILTKHGKEHAEISWRIFGSGPVATIVEIFRGLLGTWVTITSPRGESQFPLLAEFMYHETTDTIEYTLSRGFYRVVQAMAQEAQAASCKEAPLAFGL